MTSNLVYDLSQLPGQIQYSVAVVPPPCHLFLQNPAPSYPWLAPASLACTAISTAFIHAFLFLLCSPKSRLLPSSPEHLVSGGGGMESGCGREVTDLGEGMPALSGIYFLGTMLPPHPTPSELGRCHLVVTSTSSTTGSQSNGWTGLEGRQRLWVCLPTLAMSSRCHMGLMRSPDAQAHNAAGKPCCPAVILHGFSGNVCLSYRFPVMPEALRCPSARTATWALRMSHPLFPCSPQPSLWQGLATNSRNESEARVAEGPEAHPWASQHMCPSYSTTGGGVTHSSLSDEDQWSQGTEKSPSHLTGSCV